MKSFATVIFVDPTAKARARSTVIAGHVHEYTPKKTANAEMLIIAAIRQKIGPAFTTFDAGVPLRLEATFYILRPKSLPKRVTMPVKKPDVDNYGKLVMDALNHFVYPSDSQVTTLVLRKRFVSDGQVPRIELRIREEDCME